MLNRKFIALILLFVMLFLLASCASQKSAIKDFGEMTPKERVTWMWSVYNSQADNYKLQVKRTNLTVAEIEILNKKKAALTDAWLAINAYDTVVVSGIDPTLENEQKALAAIDALTAIVMPLTQ
jgi:hypothetical protein